MDIADKNAIVVGGASGMAKASAELLVAKGAAVAIIDRPQSAGAEVAAALNGTFHPCDVTDAAGTEAAIDAAVEALGGSLHISVNTAGGGIGKRTLTKEGPHPLEDFRGVIELNLISSFNVARLAASHMSRNAPEDDERGVIISTASIAAFEGQIGQVAYTAAKAGIAGMVFTMARDLGSLGIRALAIAPSLFATGLTAGIPDEFEKALTKDAAFPKRMGRPDEYGKLVLAIVENPMLNAQCIRLDAGQRFAPSSPAVTVDPELVDVEALARWMDDAGLPGTGEQPTVESVSGGSQNELFSVRRGDADLILRRPPKIAAANRLDTFAREHRVLEALRDTDVPHARYRGGTDDASILGQPFFVMDRVDGWSVMQTGGWPAPFDTDLEARAGLAFELVGGIAKLASVDWKAVGLEGFGRPEGFHDRQVDRWLEFLNRFKLRDLPGLDEAAAWLRSHRPAVYEPGILHGDYQFANVMFAHGAPARLAAIIDWEMTTVGDPLLDLGWALIGWGDEGSDVSASGYADMTGMPSRDALLDHYSSISGRPTDDIDYYVILARFKLGIVLEQSVARFSAGEADEKVEAFRTIVPNLIRKAAELAAVTP